MSLFQSIVEFLEGKRYVVGFTIIGGEINRSSLLVSFVPAESLRISVELLWEIVDAIEFAIS